MTIEKLSGSIIESVGGAGNILSAVNCMTRLRITVRDGTAIREDALKGLEGVLGVLRKSEEHVEIVVGPGKSSKCMDVFRALGINGKPQAEPQKRTEPANRADGKSGFRRLTGVFGQIFAPLIPGIIVSGLCAGIAALIRQAAPGYADIPVLSVLLSLLSGINAAFMTYLSAWAGYRAAEAFGGSAILGGMVGMFTSLDHVNEISKAVGLFSESQPLNSILRSGRGGLLAALIGVWLMCRIENAIRRRIPDALDTAFTPLLTLLATLVPYALVIMPSIGLLSTGLCRGIGYVALNPNAAVRMIAGYIGAALFLPMVALGMHHGLIALYAVQLETFGYVTLYPALAMAGAGQIGAALAVLIKAKRLGNRRLCRVINGTMPAAILGVGEPMIYGVTLPMGRPFLTAGLGAGFGGAFVMLMQVASTTWGPSGVLGTFVMTEGPRGAAVSVCCYLIGLAISCAAAYIITAASVGEEAVMRTPE
ncbi:MAG: PTS transporter subunit EIIC [Clostridia bacterium]|nr:PTS transporter subunit EIIC [Clostridia bacterium]